MVTCTGGERGTVPNPAMDRPEVRGDLARIRRAEMTAARDILGVRQQFLGFVDSGLPAAAEPLPDGCFAVTALEEPAERLVALIRRLRPHVMITYDETGGYPHPDHIRTHAVTVAAFEAAGDADRDDLATISPVHHLHRSPVRELDPQSHPSRRPAEHPARSGAPGAVRAHSRLTVLPALPMIRTTKRGTVTIRSPGLLPGLSCGEEL